MHGPKKSVLLVILLTAVSAMTVAGATMAWFTDSAAPINNDFTAGVVEISAEETIFPPAEVMENWNPGDCTKKEYTIINTGAKTAYIRGIFTGKWYLSDGITEFLPDPDLGVVTWELHPEGSDNNWTKAGTAWYYNNPIPGTYTQADVTERQRTLTLKVCLNGNDTDNQYQGKVFKLFAVFNAVQSSNGAVNDVWPDNPYVGNGNDDEDPPIGEYPLWDSENTYFQGDRVIYNNKLFEARNWTKNEQPGLMDSPWQEITNQWRDFNEYNLGEEVIYNGARFIARSWSKDQQPGLLDSPWQEITDEWRFFNQYSQGDEVIYNGATFKARNASKDQQPGLIDSPWQEITQEWRFFNIYVKDDQVYHNGILYIAKWYSQNLEPGLTNAWQIN